MHFKNKRNCPLCDGRESEPLYVQKFSGHPSHIIACCRDCGFVFVNNAPPQAYYNRYYRDMSKYEVERDYDVHQQAAKIIKGHCRKNTRILDIGCSIGHLLHLLRKAGWRYLSGIDPSPQCKRIARKRFGLTIHTSDISSFSTKRKYDLVILCSVLEHLVQVKKSMKKIEDWLAVHGQVLVVVPDAEGFAADFGEPFGEFSTEHINFFSFASLCRLMEDFSCRYVASSNNALFSLWQRRSELRFCIERYIERSKEKFARIDVLIKRLPGRVVVWGAGSLTRRLLEATDLGTRVVKFVENNTRLVGKRLGGIEIISPDRLSVHGEPIVICSFRFRDEIMKEIKSRGLRNRTITLKG